MESSRQVAQPTSCEFLLNRLTFDQLLLLSPYFLKNNMRAARSKIGWRAYTKAKQIMFAMGSSLSRLCSRALLQFVTDVNKHFLIRMTQHYITQLSCFAKVVSRDRDCMLRLLVVLQFWRRDKQKETLGYAHLLSIRKKRSRARI